MNILKHESLKFPLIQVLLSACRIYQKKSKEIKIKLKKTLCIYKFFGRFLDLKDRQPFLSN